MADESTGRFAFLRQWVARQPRWRLAVVGLMALAVVASCVYYLGTVRPRQQKQTELTGLWQRFDQAARQGNDDELTAILEEIQKSDPEDPLARTRLESLRQGEADPSDEPMLVLCVMRHFRAGHLSETAREADKLLKRRTKDSLAWCMKAHVALKQGDAVAVHQALDQLGTPQDPEARTTPFSLHLSFELFRAAGRDTEPLRQYVSTVYCAVMGRSDVLQFPIPVKLLLLQCYLDGFQGLPGKALPAGMSQGWTGATGLVEKCLEETPSVDQQIQIGKGCQNLRSSLDLLLRANQITEEQHRNLSRDLDAQTRKVWSRLLEKSPGHPDGCHGLAICQLRAGEVAAAWESVQRGLANSGENPALLALHSLLLQSVDAREALRTLAQAVEKRPDNVNLWLLLAETASVARQRDVSIMACRKARELAPKNPWVIRSLAMHEYAAGDYHVAVQMLRELGVDSLLKDPLAAGWYARCLLAAGQTVLVPDFLQAIESEAVKANQPGLISAVLLGLAESQFDTEIHQSARSMADRALKQWALDPQLMYAAAIYAYFVAEQATPTWETKLVNEAVRALEQARLRLPEHRELACRLAWLLLRVTANPGAALSAIAPLTTNSVEPLSAFQEVVLAGAYLEHGRTEEAVRVLERSPHANTAGAKIQLALAYHVQGKADQARQQLAIASGLPKRPGERVEYQRVAKLIKGEMP